MYFWNGLVAAVVLLGRPISKDVRTLSPFFTLAAASIILFLLGMAYSGFASAVLLIGSILSLFLSISFFISYFRN